MTHLLAGGRERKVLLREKAERLYVCVEEFENAWGQQAVMLAGAVRNEISYNQYLDLFNEAAKSFDGKLYRSIEVTTRAYFPALSQEMERVFKIRDRFAELQMAHKAAYKEGEFDAFSWPRDFHPLVLEFRGACEDYKSAIVHCIRKAAAL